MPMYDYKCAVCTRKREVLLKLADIESPVYCQRCGGGMNRMLSAPFIRADYPAYESPVVPGKIISGRRAHEEHLKETGCRLYEPGERQAYERSLVQADEALDTAVETTVEEFIHKLPVDKREKLAVELQNGVTAEVVRQSV